jgi:hypothetical protein
MIFKFEIVTTVVAIATIAIQAHNNILGLTGLLTVTGIAYIALEHSKPKRE